MSAMESNDEAGCQFVSSRGLLKSCRVRSMNPKSSCTTDLQYITDFIEVQHLDRGTSPVSIYVCCDAFQTFIQEYARQIHVPYIVVCGDGDLTMFREAVPTHPNQFVMFMLNPNMRGLFSQNMDIHDCRVFLKEKITKLWNANASVFKATAEATAEATESVAESVATAPAYSSLDDAIQTAQNKLKQFPIGMDYHTISANPRHHWLLHSSSSTEASMTTPVAQERILVEQIREGMMPFYQRKIRIYSNVMLCPDRFNDRVSAITIIPSALITQQNGFIPRTETWKNMVEYAFVLSPFGNGMDCHRTWEALLCGCIPIVRSSVFNELFDGLPVLIVDKWEDISLQLLVTTLSQFKDRLDNNEFNYDKLRLSYYTKMFITTD